jgi:hypothetical protein
MYFFLALLFALICEFLDYLSEERQNNQDNVGRNAKEASHPNDADKSRTET